MNEKPVCLCVGGVDPSGEAGLWVDGFAVRQAGAEAWLVPACLTAQSAFSAAGFLPVDRDFLSLQIQTLAEHGVFHAIKTGALCSGFAPGLIADVVDEHEIPLVVDPVLKTSSGMRLNEPEQLTPLFSRAALITPNVPEAEFFTGTRINGVEAMIDAAHELLQTGASAVLVKGGHLAEPADVLVLPDHHMVFKHRKKSGRRGTGCALASFVAGKLALGFDVVCGVEQGIAWLHRHYLV